MCDLCEEMDDVSDVSEDASDSFEESLDSVEDWGVYHAIPNSEIEIIMEDGLIDTAEHIQEELELVENENNDIEQSYSAELSEDIFDMDRNRVEDISEKYLNETERMIHDLGMTPDMEAYVRAGLEEGNKDILELFGLNTTDEEEDEGYQKVKRR